MYVISLTINIGNKSDKTKYLLTFSAASELGPEFKITTLVGSQIILDTTLVGSQLFIGTTLVVSRIFISTTLVPEYSLVSTIL
jgi:hypothetical protein